MPFFSANEGIGQGSTFLPILLALFIILIFHIFEKRIKNINILISFLLFVDDSLFISQEKSFIYSNTNTFCSYNIMITLLDQFGLVVEHGKTEVFYFSRSIGAFDSLALDLSQISRLILYSKDIWRYLGFIFDRKLSFQQHINHYANKALSTVKCMKNAWQLNV